MVFVLRSKDNVVVEDKNNDNNNKKRQVHTKLLNLNSVVLSGMIKKLFKKNTSVSAGSAVFYF